MTGVTSIRSDDILLNDVIGMGDPPRPWRVVHVSSERFILFDLTSTDLLPMMAIPAQEIDDDPTVHFVGEHDFNVTVSEASLTEKRRKRRADCVAMIAPLLALDDYLFDERIRSEAISAIVQPADGTKGYDRKTVKVTLDRYFRFGMTATAAMPSFRNIGGPGVPKRAGERKLGRPREYGSRPGTNVTAEMAAIFKRGLRRYFLKNRKMNFEQARIMILRDFGMEKRIDPSTRSIVHTAKQLYREEDFPTTRQIRWWYKNNEDELGFKRERVGRRKYDRDMRGPTGNAASRAFGPGSRFEIDATIANIYVVSELEPNRVVGRPVIYVIVDTFSKMVVGLYVGLEGPSWTGAMMALVNMVTPKKAFCAEYGITISEDEWPCQHIPEKLLGDRGEISKRVIEGLQANQHLTVESAQSYRPDWKGTVEKMFDLLDCEMAPYTDSYVEPDFGERGGGNYVLDAAWTIYDVTAAMIDIILRLNNHRTIVGYKRPRAMIADGVDAVPIHMWDWGIARRSGSLRRGSPERMAFDVMPTSVVRVTANGIKLRGLLYTCDLAISQRWTDLARQRKSWTETVSFDPRSTTHIYLHVATDPRGYVVCRLTDADRAYRDISFAEARDAVRAAKSRAADRSIDVVERKADSATRLEAIEHRAKERLSGSKRRPRDVSDRRTVHAVEKARNRGGEAFDLAPPIDQTNSAEVVQLRPSTGADDVSELDLASIFASKRKDDHDR